MWDWSGVEGMFGPMVGFLAACLLIMAAITVGWMIVDALRQQK